MESITITIDTREQTPYRFQIPSHVCTVPVGDYSIKGLEDCIAIERKTLDDLIGCLTTGRERFEKELQRGRAFDYFGLVVEGSLSDLANGRYKSKMIPKSAVESLLAFSVRYRLPIFFCENRKYGARVTESLLCKYAREIEKRFKILEEKSE